MSTIAERLSEVDTKLNNILTNANTELTNKGKTAVSDLSDLPSAVGELKNPTGTINITENGTVDVSNYASADVSVSGSGGKNVQYKLGMFVNTRTSYGYSGMSITVAKTGTYTIKWLCQRMSQSGTSGTQIRVNGYQVGNDYTTWGLTYYINNAQNANPSQDYVLNEITNVSLNENDVVDLYGKSNSNGNWEYNYALVIEEE
ncbi:MAG: hypothetical protein U0L22_08120 [Bacteroidales bacterium]|nr:hypothetical protein [Bacteroidales bacterium]